MVKLNVATTRSASAQPGEFFSSERSSRTNFARIDVSVPPSHQTGNIELPRELPADPEKHFVLYNAERLASAESFLKEINAAAQNRPKGQRSAMVFIHGYNTNMTEAVARFAQLVHDTGYTGVPVLFTWPSARRSLDYVTDINSAAYSRDALAEFILLMNRSNVERFDVVAHSMGNFLLMETARSLALSRQLNSTGRLGSVVMAAPDIDIDVFEKQLQILPQSVRDRLAVLVSQDDKALRLSRRISGNTPRLGAGDLEELDKFGIRIIDITEIDDQSSLSHSKFANSPEIVRLIGLRLAEGDSFAPATSTTGLIAQEFGNVLSLSLPLQ